MNNKCAKFQTAPSSIDPPHLYIFLQFYKITIKTWLTYSQTKRPRNMKFDIKVTQYKCKKY